jgi:hypothetical protein
MDYFNQMEGLMKKITPNPPLFSGRFARFIVAMLTVSFMVTTSAIAAGPAAVNLGSIANFTVLAKSGISTVGTTSIIGDIGISPAAASYITGFALSAPPTTFTTSSLVTGNIYAADYTPPTPAHMTSAISDMETAYTDAASRTLPDATELGAGNISGMTLAPGLYKWGTGLLIDNTGITLSGSADDVWIFQIAETLTVSSGAIVTLSGGAQARNIFWQVAGQTTLETTSQFKGNILDQTAIVMNTGATLNGRALAQTAVTLDANTIIKPADKTTAVENHLAPDAFSLTQNFPNPFNPSTTIQYSLSNAGMVSLKVYNIVGQEEATLVNSYQEAGHYTLTFNAEEGITSLSNGVYFYRLEAGSFVSLKKFVFMK